MKILAWLLLGSACYLLAGRDSAGTAPRVAPELPSRHTATLPPEAVRSLGWWAWCAR